MEKVTPHDKFISDHRLHLVEVFADEDAVTSYEGAIVYSCQEDRCMALPCHAHKRRPYLVYYK